MGLQHCITLIRFYLQGNHIGDVSVKAFAEALSISHTLKLLNLDGNQMGDEGVRELGTSLCVNQTLTILSLKHSH